MVTNVTQLVCTVGERTALVMSLGEDVQHTIKPRKTRSSRKNLRHQLFSSDGLVHVYGETSNN
jgi:hypothetical protein